MKYTKPEISVVQIETQPIAASGLNGWLAGTGYEGAEEYITDFLTNS